MLSPSIKKLLFIVLIPVLIACNPIINNNEQTLDQIFARSSFDIEIQSYGCFGGDTQLLHLTKEDNGYLVEVQSTGRSHLIAADKVDSLRLYLKPRIGKKEGAGCTTYENIRIGTLFSSVDYEHNYCSGKEATFMNDLLGYHQLVYLQ